MTEPTLIDFLEARLDEQEARALDRGDGSRVDAYSSPGHDRGCARAIMSQAQGRSPSISDIQVEHLLQIGFWRGQQNYRDVLADVAAKRQIIQLHLPKDNFPTECRTCTWNDPWEGFFSLDMPCPTLRLLALPWASHPDYRPEWAPDAP